MDHFMDFICTQHMQGALCFRKKILSDIDGLSGFELNKNNTINTYMEGLFRECA